MRQIALILHHSQFKRAMLYGSEDGFYLFIYNQLQDGSCLSDSYFDTLEEVYDFCKQEYDVNNHYWKTIADPEPNCQHDWIAPVRVKGRINENPQWGKFEKLVDGEWRDL